MTAKQKIVAACAAGGAFYLASLACCAGTTWFAASNFATRKVQVEINGKMIDVEKMREAATRAKARNDAIAAALESLEAADKSRDKKAIRAAEKAVEDARNLP